MSPFHIRLNCPLPPILFLAPVVCDAEERTEDPEEMRMFSLGITTTLREDDICFPFGLMLPSSFFSVCFTRKKRLYSARGVSTGEKSRSEIGKVSEASFSPFFFARPPASLPPQYSIICWHAHDLKRTERTVLQTRILLSSSLRNELHVPRELEPRKKAPLSPLHSRSFFPFRRKSNRKMEAALTHSRGP